MLKEKLLEDLKVTGKTLIVVKELTDNLILASRNLSNVKVIESHEINTYDVLNYIDDKFYCLSFEYIENEKDLEICINYIFSVTDKYYERILELEM